MRLDLPLPGLVRRLAQTIAERGGTTYAVGGSVRDHLLGHAVKDWDIEVHGITLDALEGALRAHGRVNTVGKSFGVFKLMRKGDELDISVPRRDSKVGPGHRGIAVQGDPFMGLDEAVRRRDLTINALMVDVLTGDLHDRVGGIRDLTSRALRAVDETTFLEDPLRTLRVVQFAARFDFTPDPTLLGLCRRAAIDELPAERVLGEWMKLMLRGRRPSAGLTIARETGLADRLFPSRVDAPDLDTALDRFATGFAIEPPADTGRRLAAGMLIWLAATPMEGAAQTFEALGLHSQAGYPVQRRVLEALPELPHTPDSDVKRRHASTRCELDLLLTAQAALRPQDTSVAHARHRAQALGILHQKPAPLVQGRDLIQLGVRPGPAMGQTLATLYVRQLDGELVSREQALEAAREAVAG